MANEIDPIIGIDADKGGPAKQTFLDPESGIDVSLITRARSQAHRRRASVQVMINGRDLTQRFDPYLISVEVLDVLNAMDTCVITLDDRDGKLILPPDDVPVVVRMGWTGEGPRIPIYRKIGADYDVLPYPDVLKGTSTELPWEESGFKVVFQGWVASVECGFSRSGGGRRLWIEAKGARGKFDAKTQRFKHWGSGDPMTDISAGVGVVGQGGPGGADASAAGGVPLSIPFSEAAKDAGYAAKIHPDLAKLTRGYWFMNESFMNFGARLAQEVGGNFKIVGNTAILTKADSNTNVDGQPNAAIEAIWGLNLINYRIKPYVASTQFKAMKVRWFDPKTGTFKHETKETAATAPFGGATAVGSIPSLAPNASVASQLAEGMNDAANMRRGEGWAVINGEPSCYSGARMLILRARDGIDGTYTIKETAHNYMRGGGYTTRCTLVKPFPYHPPHWGPKIIAAAKDAFTLSGLLEGS